MELTLVIFYYIYLGLVAFFLIFALFHLYHLFRFGFITFGTIFFAVVFIGITTAVLIFSFQALADIDWTEPIYFFETTNNGNFF